MKIRYGASLVFFITGLYEIYYIFVKDCSLLSLEVHPDYVCGEASKFYVIPAIGFIILGLIILMKKSWFEKIGYKSISNGELSALAKDYETFKVQIFELPEKKGIKLIFVVKNKEDTHIEKKINFSPDHIRSIFDNVVEYHFPDLIFTQENLQILCKELEDIQ